MYHYDVIKWKKIRVTDYIVYHTLYAQPFILLRVAE